MVYQLPETFTTFNPTEAFTGKYGDYTNTRKKVNTFEEQVKRDLLGDFIATAGGYMRDYGPGFGWQDSRDYPGLVKDLFEVNYLDPSYYGADEEYGKQADARVKAFREAILKRFNEGRSNQVYLNLPSSDEQDTRTFQNFVRQYPNIQSNLSNQGYDTEYQNQLFDPQYDTFTRSFTSFNPDIKAELLNQWYSLTPAQQASYQPTTTEKISEESKIEDFTNKLLDQAAGKKVDWTPPSYGPRGELISQNIPDPTSSPSDSNLKGQRTDIRYDPTMKMYVPMVPAGQILNTILKQAQELKGPRGELTAQYSPYSPGPSGPRGLDRSPGSYHPSNIMPLITPGSSFGPGEGYMIQDPFKGSPQTGPGLSQTGPRGEDIAQVRYGGSTPSKDTWEGPSSMPGGASAPSKKPSDYDEHKALLAKQASDEYKRKAQVTEDPFRASAFG